MNINLIRWVAIVILPLILAIYVQAAQPANAADVLVNGIILACANVFLLKWVLFAYIGARLKADKITQKHALWQFVPLILFAIYIVYYFQAA
ncbi:hypothetical protein [Alysiella filiformis]|uniref:Cytochrome C oxidase subunit IV n=1 Tax=Alysiella filiformis DSM 16848 TaxID=1120981 RepID=A0A286E6Z0_9NEIS|nr:hypothetical protein [Alysiella filiformis]QMT31554.1 hypothetical protein H3L97_01185 [Alysiella filiformis]UBQ55433.1 hypothetical protein JF568_07490 [Alysiella filiformis DSM 16848]SOD66677.1 hypothetical protein SAMN02746062_00692 [Alysiella filiformis DSM 16848]